MNDTKNLTSEPAWRWMSVKVIIFSSYTIIFILASMGNYLVVFVVVRNKSMQTITNLFITNLALSDILTTLVAIPFTPAGVYLDEWIFPDFLCKLLPMTMGLSVYVSTLTSTAIALDRYIVIVHPFVPRMKMKICILIIFLIWVIGTLITLPLAFSQRKVLSNETNKTECREDWGNSMSGQIFTSFNFILQFVLPCLIISICYYFVSKVLKRRDLNKLGCGMKSPEREELEVKRKRRTNQMLIAMVTIFVLCWTPLNVLWILQELSKLNIFELDPVNFYLLFLIAHLIAMSGTMYNPFLYGWMNKNFRMEFQKVLPCLKISSEIPYKIGNEENTHFKRGSDVQESFLNPDFPQSQKHSAESVEPYKSPHLQVPTVSHFNGRFKVSSL